MFKALKRVNINKNCFSQLSKPHTVKPWFCVVLKHFRGNSLKIFFLVKKKNISERSSEIIRKFVFLNKFEKEQIQRKIRICRKQPFLFNAVKLDKYIQKMFFSSKWVTHSYTMLLGCFEAFLGKFTENFSF